MAAEVMERVLQQLGETQISHDSHAQMVATVRPQVTQQIQPMSQQLPEDWKLAGFTRNNGRNSPQTLTTSRQNRLPPRVNHPTRMVETMSNVQVSQGAISRTIPTTRQPRPPRHVRRLEDRRREQDKEAQRDRKEFKEDQRGAEIEANQRIREDEAEQAYQKRQEWLKTQEKERRARQEVKRFKAASSIEAVLQELMIDVETRAQEADYRRQQCRPELVETASRRMWCRRCGKRCHQECDCHQLQ